MIDIHVREIIDTPTEELWSFEETIYNLQFDDGTIIETRLRPIIYSRFIWLLFEHYPKAQVLPYHFIGKSMATSTLHLNYTARGIWGIKDDYNAMGLSVHMSDMRRLAYEIYSNLYNSMSTMIEEYTGSICMFDVIDVLFTEEVMEANSRLINAKITDGALIAEVHDDIWDELLENEKIKYNPLSKAAKGGFVSKHSLLQCISARGLVTDADSNFFKKPIINGFATGLTTLAELAMESRSATKSVMYNDSYVSVSEYLNRLIQLCMASLSNLYHQDCGNVEFLTFDVLDKSALRNIEGKSILKNGVWTRVEGREQSLIGTKVQLRSVRHCKVNDRMGICIHCLGEVGDALAPNDNLGHFSGLELLAALTQLLLSNKHLDMNVMNSDYNISEEDSRYISNDISPDKLWFNKRMTRKNVAIVIGKDELPNINDIKYTNNASLLNGSTMSEIRTILVRNYDEKGGYVSDAVDVVFDGRPCFLTGDALAYLKENGWTHDDVGNYIIDLIDWDYKKPFLSVPIKQFSSIDYMNEIESFVKSAGSKVDKFTSYSDFGVALMAFYRLVSKKLDIHVSHLEVILQAMTSVDPRKRDYRLPEVKSDGVPTRHSDLMTGRSLSLALAYEDRIKTLHGLTGYLNTDRQYHPFDPIVLG